MCVTQIWGNRLPNRHSNYYTETAARQHLTLCPLFVRASRGEKSEKINKNRKTVWHSFRDEKRRRRERSHMYTNLCTHVTYKRFRLAYRRRTRNVRLSSTQRVGTSSRRPSSVMIILYYYCSVQIKCVCTAPTAFGVRKLCSKYNIIIMVSYVSAAVIDCFVVHHIYI